MMPLNPSRLFLARAMVDMRKSYDGLVSLVVGQLDGDPLHGDAYVFVGRDRRRLKILVWDGDGFWIYMKRLTKGRFILPHPALDRLASSVVRLDAASWGALLSGVEMTVKRRSPRYSSLE
jgi:transposase